MRHTLHVINGSHPCATVLRALELKGIDVKIVEYMPPLHAPIVRMRFGSRRVPLLKLADTGEIVPGSRRILQRLEALQPSPPLYPREHIAAIEEAERWGDEVLQDAARRLLWLALKSNTGALASFQAGSRLPRLPAPLVKLFGPVVIAGEYRLNAITEARVRADLIALPGLIARLRGFQEDGALGTSSPTAADLQIGASLQLLRSIEDLRPLVDEDPLAREIARWLPVPPGRVPAGTLGSDLLALAGISVAAPAV